MIIYHPKSDIYHCMYRFITIAKLQNLDQFEFIRLRIYDLLFLFPHLAEDISYPRVKGVAKLKRLAADMPAPYEKLPDRKRLFSEMGDYHIQALQILIAKGIFQESEGMLKLSEAFYSEPINQLLEQGNEKDNSFFCNLAEILNGVDVAGEAGLKKRTGLMEYRYDAV